MDPRGDTKGFPEDRPRLGAVALHRIAGTNHPVGRHPDSVEAVAEAVQRCLVPSASVVDATVALAAERVPAHFPCTVVEVLTPDVADISALAAHVTAPLAVVTL